MKRLLGATIVSAMFCTLAWVVSWDTGNFVQAAVITAIACGVAWFLALVVIPVLVWCFE